jgi:HEAT repeats
MIPPLRTGTGHGDRDASTTLPSTLLARAVVLGAAAWMLWPAEAAAAPKLRYHFEAGRQYVYHVKIEATFDDSVETREGLSYLNVTSSAEPQFTVRQTGRLGIQRKSTGRPGLFGRPDFGPRFPWADIAAWRPCEFTLNAQGRVIKTEGGSPLPFMLGNLEFLTLEEFPAESQSKWTQKRTVTITDAERTGFPRAPFGPRADSGIQRSAQETVSFAIRQSEPDVVRIQKQYELRSEELIDGHPHYELSGEGELVFDVKQAVFRSQSMKYTLVYNEKNIALKVPVTVECRLLNEAEVAQRLRVQKQAQATAEAATAKANEPKPLGPGEREKALRDLKARDEWTVRAAADRLAKAPADSDPEAVAAALTSLLGDRNSGLRAAAAKALINWGTANTVAALRTAVTDPDFWVRKAAMEALARFPSLENAQAIAARLVELGERADAAKALDSMGAAAEPAVLAYLKDRDGWVRLEACKILGHIGTTNSLPALEGFGANGQGFDKPESEKAIQAIKSR